MPRIPQDEIKHEISQINLMIRMLRERKAFLLSIKYADGFDETEPCAGST